MNQRLEHLIQRQTDKPTDQPTNKLIKQPTNRFIERPSGSLKDFMIE